MSSPVRIQLQRTKGFRLPVGSTKVDRSTRWGNPFRVGDDGVPDAAAALRLFQKLLDDPRIADSPVYFVFTRERLRADLGGRHLACWCALPAPGASDLCHAALLLRLANEGTDPSAGSITDSIDVEPE